MAKTKTKKTEQSAEEIAVLLGEVRGRMNEDKKLNDVLTSAFKAALKREHKNRAGNYRLLKGISFKIAASELALPFAIEHNLVKIDTTKAHEVFRKSEQFRFENPLKYGFEEVPTEKVDPIKKAKSSEEEIE